MAVPQLQIPGYAAPQPIDFATPLAQLGQQYQAGQKRMLLSDLAQGGNQDPQALIRAGLATGDMSLATLGATLATRQHDQFRQSQQDQLQRDRYGVEDNFKKEELRLKEAAVTGKNEKPSAAEMKTFNTAESEIPNIDATIANVKRALELNPQVYSGVGASMRGALGAKAPDWMIPDAVASPERGKATAEWEQLMGGEAIKNMSETLKGASTDFEMRKFLGLAADTSLPPETRKNAMNRFLSLADQEKQLRVKRLDFMKNRYKDYYKSEGGAAPSAAASAPNQRAIDALRADGSKAAEFDAKFGAGAAARILGQ